MTYLSAVTLARIREWRAKWGGGWLAEELKLALQDLGQVLEQAELRWEEVRGPKPAILLRSAATNPADPFLGIQAYSLKMISRGLSDPDLQFLSETLEPQCHLAREALIEELDHLYRRLVGDAPESENAPSGEGRKPEEAPAWAEYARSAGYFAAPRQLPASAPSGEEKVPKTYSRTHLIASLLIVLLLGITVALGFHAVELDRRVQILEVQTRDAIAQSISKSEVDQLRGRVARIGEKLDKAVSRTETTEASQVAVRQRIALLEQTLAREIPETPDAHPIDRPAPLPRNTPPAEEVAAGSASQGALPDTSAPLVAIETPSQHLALASAQTPDTGPTETTASPAPKGVSPPPENQENERGRWSIRLITVSAQDRAEELRGLYAAKGFQAGIRVLPRAERNLYGLEISGFRQRSEAENRATEIKRALGLTEVLVFAN